MRRSFLLFALVLSGCAWVIGVGDDPEVVTKPDAGVEDASKPLQDATQETDAARDAAEEPAEDADPVD